MGKITEEELSRINTIKQTSIEIASILGELSYNKIILENEIELQKSRIFEVKKQEVSLFQDLKTKYGDVTINIETGEFN
jgi:hypothetical protein